jgi:hypothetical protein
MWKVPQNVSRRRHPGEIPPVSGRFVPPTTQPDRVVWVEQRTFICSVDPADAGPTNNWMAPSDMKREMTALYRGSMRCPTMYVMPFCIGPLTAEKPMFGVRGWSEVAFRDLEHRKPELPPNPHDLRTVKAVGGRPDDALQQDVHRGSASCS